MTSLRLIFSWKTGLNVTVSSNYFFFSRLSSEIFVYSIDYLLKWLSPQMTGLRVTGSRVTISSNYFLFIRRSYEIVVYSSDHLLKWLSPNVTGSSDCLKLRVKVSSNYFFFIRRSYEIVVFCCLSLKFIKKPLLINIGLQSNVFIALKHVFMYYLRNLLLQNCYK